MLPLARALVLVLVLVLVRPAKGRVGGAIRPVETTDTMTAHAAIIRQHLPLMVVLLLRMLLLPFFLLLLLPLLLLLLPAPFQYLLR